MKKMKLSMMAIVIIGTLISCGKDSKPDPTPPTPPVAVIDSIDIPFSSNNFTLYSFKNKTKVANNDSISTKWDIGFRRVAIILNSHASGPGNAGAITQAGIYDSYLTAPDAGYSYDTTTMKTAIDASENTGWYNYNENTHAFSPKAGKFFVIRTADNHFVKLEILSVVYLPFPGQVPITLRYKFRYSYQENGRNF